MPPSRRAEDKGHQWWKVLLRENWYRDVWLLLITLLVLLTINTQAGETKERRDQLCILFEGQERAAVQRLTATYAFLQEGTGGPELRAAIIASLTDVEREARTTVAPAFCSEPGIGLKGDRPEVPDRPPGIPAATLLVP